MSTIYEIHRKIETLDLWSIVKKVILKYEQKILDYQTGQLFDGKTRLNQDIRPYYTEDPYFKTKAAGVAYAKWKQKLTPNPRRNFKAPNLFINGYFHSMIELMDKGRYIEIGSKSFGKDFDSKFKNIYGLTDENRMLLKEFILPEIQTEIKRHFNI